MSRRSPKALVSPAHSTTSLPSRGPVGIWMPSMEAELALCCLACHPARTETLATFPATPSRSLVSRQPASHLARGLGPVLASQDVLPW